MKVILRKCFLLLGLMLLSGCMVEHKNISGENQFRDLIGAKYKTLIELRIHGFTLLGKSSDEMIDMYLVTEIPGFAGLEVIERMDLEAGSVIKVNAVRKCTICLSQSINFGIEIFSDELKSNIPIWLHDLSIKDDRGNIVMDPKKLLRITDPR